MSIAPARLPEITAMRLAAFIEADRHGEMQWIADKAERRSSPERMWGNAKTAIVLAMNYGPEGAPLAGVAKRDAGTIALYARGRDYHEVVKGKLKQLAQWLARRAGTEIKVFVDTAPLMEKPLAQLAGLGWQGKHTNLVSRSLGSWFFLGVILTDAALEPDAPEADHCGSCRACLDACPTDAFPAPYQLDARRCISYLTIEHAGHIGQEFRAPMGNRIFGCDDCLAACPWNKFAELGREAKLDAREDLVAPPLAELAALDDKAFRERFAGTSIKRTGRDRFVRNVMIAIGNSGDAGLAGSAEAGLRDASPLVRAMAVWALGRLASESLKRFRQCILPEETDAAVRAEWERAA
ncbi:MAG: tRNA epoxyqueuosine(34) reductase QueG [Parvibaculaceae bacterium]